MGFPAAVILAKILQRVWTNLVITPVFVLKAGLGKTARLVGTQSFRFHSWWSQQHNTMNNEAFLVCLCYRTPNKGFCSFRFFLFLYYDTARSTRTRNYPDSNYPPDFVSKNRSLFLIYNSKRHSEIKTRTKHFKAKKTWHVVIYCDKKVK